MFNKSRLQNAKLKISKLKEKYFNSFTGASSTDNVDEKESFPTTDVLFHNFELEEEERFLKLSSPDQKPHSPVIKVIVNDGDEDVNESISELLNKHSSSDPTQNFPSLSSSPEQSKNLSKITSSHALKAESIVLSELSSQFEHICFLSSSSEDEENTVHPASLTTPQSVIKSPTENQLAQSSVKNYSRNSKSKDNIKEQIDKKDQLSSDNELSEVNSYFSTISSEIKLQKYTDSYQTSQNVESQNTNDLSLKHDLTSGIVKRPIQFLKNAREQTAKSDSTRYQSNSLSWSSDYLSSNKKLHVISGSDQNDRTPDPKTQSNNNRNKKHPRKEQTSEKSMTIKTKQKNRKIHKIKDKPVKHKTNTNQRSDITITKSGGINNEISIPSLIKSHKYSKHPIYFEHSTGIEALAKRPLLKSCILVSQVELNEADKISSQITPTSISYGYLKNMDCEQPRGNDHEEVVSQLLRCQIQLTRHYIRNHHQMYLLCCQAAKLLSEEYNKNHT